MGLCTSWCILISSDVHEGLDTDHFVDQGPYSVAYGEDWVVTDSSVRETLLPVEGGTGGGWWMLRYSLISSVYDNKLHKQGAPSASVAYESSVTSFLNNRLPLRKAKQDGSLLLPSDNVAFQTTASLYNLQASHAGIVSFSRELNAQSGRC
jgi:hypothetical protein